MRAACPREQPSRLALCAGKCRVAGVEFLTVCNGYEGKRDLVDASLSRKEPHAKVIGMQPGVALCLDEHKDVTRHRIPLHAVSHQGAQTVKALAHAGRRPVLTGAKVPVRS